MNPRNPDIGGIMRLTSADSTAFATGEGRMPKLGDNITVEIKGAPDGGTALSGAVKISPGASMRTSGKILEDHGDYWLVELTISIQGKNRILVPKSTGR